MLIAADKWECCEWSNPSDPISHFYPRWEGQMLPQPWQTLSLLYSAFQSSRASRPSSAQWNPSVLVFLSDWCTVCGMHVCVRLCLFLFVSVFTFTLQAFMSSELQLTSYCFRWLFTSILGCNLMYVPSLNVNCYDVETTRMFRTTCASMCLQILPILHS